MNLLSWLFDSGVAPTTSTTTAPATTTANGKATTGPTATTTSGGLLGWLSNLVGIATPITTAVLSDQKTSTATSPPAATSSVSWQMPLIPLLIIALVIGGLLALFSRGKKND